MSPSEFGQLGVALGVGLATTLLLSLGLETGALRVYFKYANEAEAQRRAMATLATVLIAAVLAGTLVLTCLAITGVADGLLGRGELVLAVIGGALSVLPTVLPLAILRAQNRLREYLQIIATLAFGTSATTALFVLGFRWGADGWLIGVVVGNGFAAFVAFRTLPWPVPRSWGDLDGTAARAGLAIGLPLLPHLLSQWALQLSDRAVLAGITTSAAVGVYTLAFNLAVPASLVAGAVSQATQPEFAATGTRPPSPERTALLSQIAGLQVGIVTIVSAVVAMLMPVLVVVIFPAEYSAAASYLPWIAFGFLFYGLYYVPISGLSLVAGRTSWVWIGTVLAVVVKLAITFLFVPGHGVIAAAVGTLVAYAVLFASMRVLAGRTPGAHIDGDVARLTRIVLPCLMIAVTACFLTSDDTVVGALLRVLASLALPVVVLGLDPQLRHRVHGAAAARMGRSSAGSMT